MPEIVHNLKRCNLIYSVRSTFKLMQYPNSTYLHQSQYMYTYAITVVEFYLHHFTFYPCINPRFELHTVVSVLTSTFGFKISTVFKVYAEIRYIVVVVVCIALKWKLLTTNHICFACTIYTSYQHFCFVFLVSIFSPMIFFQLSIFIFTLQNIFRENLHLSQC